MDGCGEFIGGELQDFLKMKGISHEITTYYSPESNGREERPNRTLLDMALTMMNGFKIKSSEMLWA